MISVVTNAVVALMIVTTGFEKVDDAARWEFIPYWPTNYLGYCAGAYHRKYTSEELYRKVCTTNFVYQRDYDACAEAVKYFNDNFVTTNKYPVISQPMWDDQLGIQLTEPMAVPAVIHRRKGGVE